ncbi:MAG: Hpt domain-containing protein [Bacteroidetes bacterium]|nr:Hpt domain-containing protein [Bacteroidota bacterium]
MSDTPTIDLTFLQSFTGGNKDKIAKYIGIFLQMCPGQLELMRTHLASGNYDSVRGTAHALKPQITYMGIKAGEDMIKKIERHAAEKIDVESLPKMLEEFTVLCNQAMVELKAAI